MERSISGLPGQAPAKVPAFPMSGCCSKLPGSSLGFQIVACSRMWVKYAATGLVSREGGAGVEQEGLAAAVPLGSLPAFPSSGLNAISGNKEMKSRTDSGSQQLVFITLAVPRTWRFFFFPS